MYAQLIEFPLFLSTASELESQWKALNVASEEKKKKLAEATEALLFNLSMDDIEHQISAMETQLASEDHGADLPSAGQSRSEHWLVFVYVSVPWLDVDVSTPVFRMIFATEKVFL